MTDWQDAQEALGIYTHDLAKELSLILGYTELLLSPSEPLTDQQRQYVETMRRSCRRATDALQAADAHFALRTEEERPHRALRLTEATNAALAELQAQGRPIILQNDLPADLPALADNGFLTLALRLLLAQIYVLLGQRAPLPAHLSAAPADAGKIQLVISVDAGAPERAASLARRLEERQRRHPAAIIVEDLGGALAFAHDQAALQCVLRLPASRLA